MIYALVGITRHEFITQWRYWLNLVSATLFGYLLFVLVFLGVRSPDLGLGLTPSSLVVAFWVIHLTNSAYQAIRYQPVMEASVGTLEQLYLSPFPYWWISFSRLFGQFLLILVRDVPFLLLMMLTTGSWLRLDIISMLPLVVLIVAQAYGLGLAMGGMALIYKQVGAIGHIPEIMLVAFIATPRDLSPLVRLLPFNLEWHLLEGIPVWSLSAGDLALAALKTTVLIAAGWTVYALCERAARRKALLGQY